MFLKLLRNNYVLSGVNFIWVCVCMCIYIYIYTHTHIITKPPSPFPLDLVPFLWIRFRTCTVLCRTTYLNVCSFAIPLTVATNCEAEAKLWSVPFPHILGHVNTLYVKDAQIPGARPPWPLHFVRWQLVFVDYQYLTRFMYPFGAQNFEEASRFLENLCTVVLCYLTFVFICIYMSEMITCFKRAALFWGIVRRVVVIQGRRCGTTYRSHLQWSIILI
jgi:hypothetical protein